jgi:hypothetical protein
MTVNRPGHTRRRAVVRPAVVRLAVVRLAVVRPAVFQKLEMQQRPLRHAAAPLRRSVAALKVDPLEPPAVMPIA